MYIENKNEKVALVTGAARRIGVVIAQELHAHGYQIVLHCRRSIKETEQLCLNLNQKRKNSVIIITAELQDFQELSLLIQQSIAEWGRLDVLVNNASCFIKTPQGHSTVAVWDELINSNLKSPYFLSQFAYPHLVKTRGCIINIADIHAEQPLRDYAVYCVSKAGLVSLTRSLAKEWGPAIRVNAISPGMIAWPEGENAISNEVKQKIIDESALKCIGQPRDIAKAVLFLVKDADYITGQILAVDGGRLL